jgi:hypothetical protein
VSAYFNSAYSSMSSGHGDRTTCIGLSGVKLVHNFLSLSTPVSAVMETIQLCQHIDLWSNWPEFNSGISVLTYIFLSGSVCNKTEIRTLSSTNVCTLLCVYNNHNKVCI